MLVLFLKNVAFLSTNLVSKQLKRIGQLFSAAVPTGIEIPDEKMLLEDDIETKAGNFTDGCWTIGTGYAKRINICWGSNIVVTK